MSDNNNSSSVITLLIFLVPVLIFMISTSVDQGNQINELNYQIEELTSVEHPDFEERINDLETQTEDNAGGIDYITNDFLYDEGVLY